MTTEVNRCTDCVSICKWRRNDVRDSDSGERRARRGRGKESKLMACAIYVALSRPSRNFPSRSVLPADMVVDRAKKKLSQSIETSVRNVAFNAFKEKKARLSLKAFFMQGIPQSSGINSRIRLFFA